MTTKTDTEQQRAEFEDWRRNHYDYDDLEAFEIEFAFAAYQAGRAALQSQDSEEVMELALCESRRLVLRIGQAYRFVPMEGCKTCEELKAEHDQAYAIDRARRVEGEAK